MNIGFQARVRFALIGTFSLVLVVAAIAFVVAQRAQILESLQDNLTNTERVFRSQIISDGEGLARTATVLGHMDALLEPLASRNREELLRACEYFNSQSRHGRAGMIHPTTG